MSNGFVQENTKVRFFGSVRSYFKLEPHGRYFSVLLRELALSEPSSFCNLLSVIAAKDRSGWTKWGDISKQLRSKSLTVDREHRYVPKRQADLCLLENGKAKVLFEIKEFDEKKKENPDQIKSYIDYISRDAAFVFISRFAPERPVQRALMMHPDRPVIALRYYEIYDALKRCSGPSAPIARMICEYMEDINVVGYRAVNLKEEDRDLSLFFAQQLGFPGRHGLRIRQSDDALAAIPGILSRLFGNLELLGEWIRGSGNEELIPVRFMRKFEIQPYFDLVKLHKKLTKVAAVVGDTSSREPPFLPDSMQKYVTGGEVYFYAWGSIPIQGGWMGVQIGYTFSLCTQTQKPKSKTKKANCAFSLYASFFGKGLDSRDTWESTDILRRFPTEAEAQAHFRKLLQQSLRKAKKVATGSAARKLNEFKIPAA